MGVRDSRKGILGRRPLLALSVALLVGSALATVIERNSGRESGTTQIEQPPPTPWKDRDIILAMVPLSPGEELLRIRGHTRVRVSTTNRVAGFSTVAQFEKHGLKWRMRQMEFSAPGLDQKVFVDGAYGAISTDDIQAIVSLVQSSQYGPADRISIADSGWVTVKSGTRGPLSGFHYRLSLKKVRGVWTLGGASIDYVS